MKQGWNFAGTIDSEGIIHSYETTVTANDKGVYERVHRTVHFYRYSRDGMEERTNAGNVAMLERYIMSSWAHIESRTTLFRSFFKISRV